MASPTVLIVDDEKGIRSSLSQMIELEDMNAVTAGGGKEGLARAFDSAPDVIMLDVKMPDLDGLSVLAAIKKRQPDLPVVMMSGHGDIETAIRAIQLGAHDFIEKPLASDKILLTLRNALEHRRLARENRELRAQVGPPRQFVGRSAAMMRLRGLVERAAPTNGTVLVMGESGTGKELVARELHAKSKRSNESFIRLNCAAIPQELIESELFGHEKGSFTGAHQRKRGKFELAHRGTLFLDEIGDMQLEAQAKLLRVLQEGELERVGGETEIHVDVRVVAATNKDLPREIEKGRFREDLFYRINVIPMVVPPLREHREDIPELVRYFVGLACEENGWRPKKVSPDALALLNAGSYPGNVRELRNTCERLVILSPGEDIRAEDVRLLADPARPTSSGGYDPNLSLRDLLENAERGYIKAALDANAGHMTKTAESLGLERSHLYKKLKTLGIER